MYKGKTIGIISLKGGVGKTSSVANIGAIISYEFKKKVLMVDANFSAPNLGLHLGLVEPKTTIHDVLLNRAAVNDAIHRHEAGFHVIVGAYVSRRVNPERLNQKIGCLRELYDLIIIDSSPNLNGEILATMMASDELLVVTTPDYPTLSTTLRAIRLAKQRRTPITGIILNRVRSKNFELGISDIEEAAQVPVLSVLPEDINVAAAIASTTPVALHAPKSSASIEYKKLAACLIGESYNDPRLWPKLKSLLFRNMTKDTVNRALLQNERKQAGI